VHLTHLSLVDFRSYPALDLTLRPGTTVFVGSNGQGKTNLVEAVGYLSMLGSHRVAADAPLVREGAERAVVRARIVRGDRAALVELEIVPGKANRARLNRAPVPRARDILGVLATVLFAPEDLALVKGDPAERRRFLDDLLVARAPRLAAVRADYDRVLRQRSALLRTASSAGRSGGASDLRTLDVWDGHLARHGAELLAARLALVAQLRPRVAAAYTAVAGAGSVTDLKYLSSVPVPDSLEHATPDLGTSPELGTASPEVTGRPEERSALEESMLTELARVRQQEVERGVTLVGPHRDELSLSVDGRRARGYASHGESWSLALALKLASFEILRDDGREPVLLLDDVFAELDSRRRSRLADLVVAAEQVLVTAAVGDDVPEGFAETCFRVEGGQVVNDRSQ
jgi:DNA replication and repair protein RecF